MGIKVKMFINFFEAKIELNTEKLRHLEHQPKSLADEDEVNERIPSSLIKEMCA